jgi:Spy/CpxP family protein refolding chaperone
MKSYKNNRRLYMGILALILFILNLALIFTIWYPRLKNPASKRLGISEHDREMVQRYMERQLNLSPRQREEMAKLRDAHFTRADVLNEEINRIRKEIMDELFNSSPDTEKVEKLAVQLGGKQGDLEKLTFSHFLDLLTLCQPQQKQKLKTLLSDLLERLRPPKPRRPVESGHPPWDDRPGRDLGPPPGHAPPLGPKGAGYRATDHIRHLTERLGLNGEQVEQIRPIVESFAKKIKETQKQAGGDRRALGDAVKALREQRDQSIKAILTPEQKKLFEEMKRIRRPPGR